MLFLISKNNNFLFLFGFQEKLQLAKEIAAEAKHLLSFEPSNSPEGHLVRRISMQQEQIEESLNKIAAK